MVGNICLLWKNPVLIESLFLAFRFSGLKALNTWQIFTCGHLLSHDPPTVVSCWQRGWHVVWLLYLCTCALMLCGTRRLWQSIEESLACWICPGGVLLSEGFVVDLSLLSYYCSSFCSGGVRYVYNNCWVVGSVLEQYCCQRDLLWLCYSCHTAAPVSIPEE